MVNGIIRRTTGLPPCPKARRWARARPSSCSTGMKNPGTNAKVVNHNATIGLKSSLPSASCPTLKKAYAVKPEMNNPMPTGTVPSGSGIRDDLSYVEPSDTCRRLVAGAVVRPKALRFPIGRCCCVPSLRRTTQRDALEASGSREPRNRLRCIQAQSLV